MKHRTRILPVIIFAAMAIGAFLAPFLFPFAEAQRGGYVEKRAGGSAFSDQLAPGPVAGYVLTPVGTDTKQVTWTAPASGLPSGGTPGQVAGVVALTATRTVVVTGTQASTGTQTYNYTQSGTGTTTATNTRNATETYTYTATSTSTGLATSGVVDVGTSPRSICIMGSYAYVANSGAGTVSVVNISNPASPSVVATVTVGSDPRDLACDNGWVYVANYGGDSISVIDAVTPASAHVESTFSVTAGCNPRALAIRGDHLFMVCYTAATFWKINASNRASLAQSGTAFSIPTGPIDLTVDDDHYARITCQSGNKVVTVEYSWGGSPVQVGFEDNTDGVYGIYQKPLEFLAVCASTAGKLYLYDTSLSPHLIGSVTTAAGCRNPVIYGSVVISTHYDANKIQVHSIASSGNPAFVEEIAIADGPVDIKVSGDYAWVTRYGGAKLQSIYIGKYKQFSGTNTNTNVLTGTGTVTNTVATTGTGTQTVAGTGIFTSSATGIGTGTGTAWQAVYAPASSVLGDYYLFAFGSEGLCWEAAKTEDFTNSGTGLAGLIENTTITASCSSGSDGLITEFLHNSGKDPWPVWAGGMWAAHIKASSTGSAAIRVEAWDSVDGQVFTMTSSAFDSPGPSDIYVATSRPARLPSTSSNKISFKLYATCSSVTPLSVTFYSEKNLTSWIETPLHSDKQDSLNIYHNGGTVYSALSALESKPITYRSVFVPWSAFYNASSLTIGTLGSSANGTITQHAVMPDGTSISRLHGYLWKRPNEYTGGAITVRPLWVPLTTDASWTHKVSWEAYCMPLESWGEDYGHIVNIASTGGTAEQWDGDTSYSHYVMDGFLSTAIMLESGHAFTPSTFEWLRIAIGRNHASGTDTYVGDVGFVGLQIDYPSAL
jgi:YVTN family beta-propeller protein